MLIPGSDRIRLKLAKDPSCAEAPTAGWPEYASQVRPTPIIRDSKGFPGTWYKRVDLKVLEGKVIQSGGA